MIPDFHTWSFALDIQHHHRKTRIVHEALSSRLDSSSVKIETLHYNNTSFRIHLDPTNRFRVFLSIAHPFDVEDDVYCETALFIENELVFKDFLGYEDVKRFDSLEELLEEIDFLKDRLSQYQKRFRNLFSLWKSLKAKQRIQSFILKYKDHFMARPNGLLWRISKLDFEKKVDSFFLSTSN